MGKISMLETGFSMLWNAQKRKINPKTLGWVRPDGVINFQSTEVAQTYAKNRVLSALHSPKPFERAVFVEDSRIIADINGTAHKVHFDSKNVLKSHKDVALIHGHPTGTPLSDQDYTCLTANNELKSIVAYNKRGEYSKMTKQEKPVLFRFLPQKFYEKVKMVRVLTSKSMIEEITKGDFKKLIEMIKELQNNCKGMTKEEMLATEQGQKVKEFGKNLLAKMNNIWAKNEKLFGIKYETDFSKLG